MRPLVAGHVGAPNLSAAPEAVAGRPPEATPVKGRVFWWVLAILLVPAFGIGLVMMAIMALSPYRWGPCPYCEAMGRWPNDRLAQHTNCQHHSIRKGAIIYPADDRRDAWDGKTIL